jgi:exonuclease III
MIKYLKKILKRKMSLSFITWNINKANYSEIEDYLNDILKKCNPEALTFFESEKLIDSEIEKKGYKKIKLHDVEHSKKVVKTFIRTNSDYIIKNKYNFTELVVNETKSLKTNQEVKSYLIEESKVIRRIEKVSTLEAFEVKNNKTDESLLYVAIHFPSKLFQNEFEQFQNAINYKKYITSRGEEYGNKILIAGDFNMAPFEKGMTEPMGFFAFQNNNDVRSEIEHVLGSRQLSFYNPCWRLLGDYNQKTRKFRNGGSFYYEKSSKRSSKTWHLFDQIIFTKKVP